MLVKSRLIHAQTRRGIVMSWSTSRNNGQRSAETAAGFTEIEPHFRVTQIIPHGYCGQFRRRLSQGIGSLRHHGLLASMFIFSESERCSRSVLPACPEVRWAGDSSPLAITCFQARREAVPGLGPDSSHAQAQGRGRGSGLPADHGSVSGGRRFRRSP